MREASNCFILNYAPHYRKEIFSKLILELPAEIFCGSFVKGNIKKIDPDYLGPSYAELHTTWFGPFYWIKGAVSLLFKKQYKNYILTAQPTCLSDIAFVLLSKFTSKKVYFWNHGAYGNEGKLRKLFNRLFFWLFDGCFLYSNGAAELLKVHYRMKPEQVNVIYNSLDYSNQLLLRKRAADLEIIKELGVFKDSSLPTLLFIGRLTKIKRLDLLIQAHNRLFQEGFCVNLLIVGDGEERAALVQEIKNDEYIHFYGACYDEVVNAGLIANSDLCVSPGNIGLTAIHSLMYGTPVCTHDNFHEQMPEHEVIEQGKTGVYFSQKENDLASRIRYWFSLGQDRAVIRHNCYRIIDEKYNPDYQVEVFKAALA